VTTTKDDEDGYPAELESHLTLEGGWRVRIRALHTCEAEPIRALHRGLSARSRYLRFLSPMPALPDSVVRALACVDHRRSVAIVAERPDGAAIGLAGFSAVDEVSAEVAASCRTPGRGAASATRSSRRCSRRPRRAASTASWRASPPTTRRCAGCSRATAACSRA
jgi:hypothetical protein